MDPLPPPLHWRDVREGDAPVLDALFLASRDDLRHAAADPALLQILLRTQQQVHEAGLRQAYPGARRMLIEQDGEPVGQATFQIGQEELRLLDLVVAPQARRVGIARKVVAQLQEEARRRGLPMGLTVAASNAGARALYASMGFEAETAGPVVHHLRWRAEAAR